MEPLNSQERLSAFAKFLVAFLITVIIIVMAVFFDYRVPVAQNKQLIEQNAALQQSSKLAQDALYKMDSLNNYFAKFSPDSLNFLLISNSIVQQITALQQMSKQDTVSPVGKMLGRAATAYNDHYNTKQVLKTFGDDKKQIDQLKSDRDDYRQKYTECSQELNLLKVSKPSSY